MEDIFPQKKIIERETTITTTTILTKNVKSKWFVWYIPQEKPVCLERKNLQSFV